MNKILLISKIFAFDTMSKCKTSIRDVIAARRSSSVSLLPKLDRITVARRSTSLDELMDIPVLYYGNEPLPLTTKIGAGTYADIYKSVATIAGRKTKIAVKVLRNTAISWETTKDVNEEKKILLDLPKSRWIVNCYGIAKIMNDTNVAGFILEYCPDRDLYKVLNAGILRKGIKLDSNLLIEWIGHIIKAIHFLHNQNIPIVHRDVKSSNFLVSKDHTLKLCDFSLARKYTSFNQSTTLTRLRSNSLWTPPEIFNGEFYSIKSDIYSLGIVIWEVIYFWTHKTYHLPYDLPSAWYIAGLFNKFPNKRPLVDSIPKNWLHLIEASWDPDPSKRVTSEEAIKIYENIVNKANC